MAAVLDKREEASCAVCRGLGVVGYKGRDGRTAVRVCECRRAAYEQELAAKLRARCNVRDEDLERYTFAAFDPKRAVSSDPKSREHVRRRMAEVLATCETYAERPEGWMTLIGGVGSGKSHLAFALVGRLLERGVGVYWDTVPELLDHLRQGYQTGAYMQILEGMMAVRVLVLDDLGAEQETGWVTEKLFQLLNRRYTRRLPTVVTTNINLKDPTAKMDERLRSRLLDQSLSRVIMMPAGDYRVPEGR